METVLMYGLFFIGLILMFKVGSKSLTYGSHGPS